MKSYIPILMILWIGCGTLSAAPTVSAATLPDIQAYVYHPTSSTAMDGIIDLLIGPSSGSPPYHVIYHKKQPNGQYSIIKDVVVVNNGDEDMIGIGVGHYQVEIIDLHCGNVTLDVAIVLGCECTRPTLEYDPVTCILSWPSTSACDGFALSLQKQGIGLWYDITIVGPYALPEGHDGNYRLVLTKDLCEPVISDIVSTHCANTQTVSTGSLMINEFSQGCSGTEEYIELIVTGNTQYVTVEGMIIDDNNHLTFEQGNESGHIRLGSCFSYVPVGTILLIYNGADINGDINPSSNGTPGNNGVWQLSISDPCILKYPSCPNNHVGNTLYNCQASGSGEWSDLIPLYNRRDVVQVRNSDGTLVEAVIYGGAAFSGTGGNIVNIPSSSFKTMFRRINNTNWSAGDPCGNDSKTTPGLANDTINGKFITDISIVGDNNIVLVPNPAKESMEVISNQFFEGLEVIDISGATTIKLTHLNVGTHTLDIRKLTEGMHVLKLTFPNGKTEFKKFIKIN